MRSPMLPAAMMAFGLAGGAVAPAADGPKEAFVREHDRLLLAKDVEGYLNLSYRVGEPPEAKEGERRGCKAGQPGTLTEIQTVLEPLPQDFAMVRVVRGKKYEPNIPPAGLLTCKGKLDGTSFASQRPVGIVDGRMYFVGTKVTELDWKGPADTAIGINLSSTDSSVDPAFRAHCTYTASGVDLTETTTAGMFGVAGQDVTSVTVENLSATGVLTMKIQKMEGTVPKTVVEMTGQPGKGLSYKKP